MNVTRNNLSATQVELTVTVPLKDMAKFSVRAAERISENTKIEGFRPGKAPYDIVRARVGDMAILEEAARIAVSKTIDKALEEQVTEEWFGQPQITLTKLAPENQFEYRALITLLPSVELGEYKNLGIAAETPKVTDEEITKVVDHLRESRVTEAAVEREAKEGDKVLADINMFLDKVPVEGGQARETAVILGKEYLVPGFDEKITGMKVGETREFFLHYPADHFQKNLADKKVEFSVTAKQIFERALPEVDDAFAAGFGLKTSDELTKNIRQSLELEKKTEAEVKHEQKLLEEITKKATIGEISKNLIDSEARTMLHELEHNVERQGMKFADYLSSMGKNSESLLEELKPQAETRVKVTLVLRAIIKKENIDVDEKDIETELEMLRARHGKDPKALESISSPAYRRHIESTLLNRRVIEKLKEWNLAGKDV